MKKLFLLFLVVVMCASAFASSEEELDNKAHFKYMLKECNIDPLVDARVFKAFHAHSVMRSPEMDTAAMNELTQNQYYRWRIFKGMNSYGCQAFEKLMPEVNTVTTMFVKDACSIRTFRSSLRVIYDFSLDIKKKGSSSKIAQDELNQLMEAFDLAVESDEQLRCVKLLQHVYHEVGRYKEEGDVKRQSLDDVMNSLPKEFEDVSQTIKNKIAARVYVSNFNMLFDFMDKWMQQAYKDINEGCMMDNVDAIFDQKE